MYRAGFDLLNLLGLWDSAGLALLSYEFSVLGPRGCLGLGWVVGASASRFRMDMSPATLL